MSRLKGAMMTFRHWLQEMWMQYKDECQNHNLPIQYNLKSYFNQYKYWLKREYRHQTKIK
jgi:hypothetical protein